jgi:hypothetical protein
VVSPMPSPVSAARSTTPACPPHRAFASTTAPGRADGMTDPTFFWSRQLVILAWSGRCNTQLQENGRYVGGNDESLMLEQPQMQ